MPVLKKEADFLAHPPPPQALAMAVALRFVAGEVGGGAAEQ